VFLCAYWTFLFWYASQVVENNHHHSIQGVWPNERFNSDIHDLLSTVGVNHQILDFDSLFLTQRFFECSCQFVAQTFAHHDEDVPVGPASRRFQIFSRAPLV